MTSKKGNSEKPDTLTFKIPSANSFWMIAAVVLAIVLIVILVRNSWSSVGTTVSSEEIGQRVLEFAKSSLASTNPLAEVELVEVNDNGMLYEVILSISSNGDSQEVPVYITKDGESLVREVISFESLESASSASNANTNSGSSNTATSVPKADRPVVELFIWSYCPYGVQAQGPLADVANLLGNSADFKTVLYYDGHGAYETQENKIQACIQKLDEEKYWSYAKNFVATIYPKCSASKTIECDLTESTKLMDSLGIDSAAVLACVESQGDQLVSADRSKAQSSGVSGSPTLIVNGVKVNVARTAESFKAAICSAFNEAPEACTTALDSTASASSGNC